MPSGSSPRGGQSVRILILSSDFEAVLRRLKPEKRLDSLAHREVNDLPFFHLASSIPEKLLYDSTVYIDNLNKKYPVTSEGVVRASQIWHSSVTEAELLHASGRLDPRHPATAKAIARITQTLRNRPPYRTIVPDQQIWQEAGVLTGLITRIRKQEDGIQQRRLMNDALIFFSALKYGCTVLTRNLSDFDAMQQLVPQGRVLFYEVRS